MALPRGTRAFMEAAFMVQDEATKAQQRKSEQDAVRRQQYM